MIHSWMKMAWFAQFIKQEIEKFVEDKDVENPLSLQKYWQKFREYLKEKKSTKPE